MHKHKLKNDLVRASIQKLMMRKTIYVSYASPLVLLPCGSDIISSKWQTAYLVKQVAQETHARRLLLRHSE